MPLDQQALLTGRYPIANRERDQPQPVSSERLRDQNQAEVKNPFRNACFPLLRPINLVKEWIL